MTPVMGNLWEKAVEFHGHACTGLAIGCRMTMLAAARLGFIGKAKDEELFCIAETDACLVDAVQAILGCTLGKGNLILRFKGKMAMSFYCRNTLQGCRTLWRPGPGEDGSGLRDRILAEQADSCFVITDVPMLDLPKAAARPSSPCARCGEATMDRMLRPHQGSLLCPDCHPDGISGPDCCC